MTDFLAFIAALLMLAVGLYGFDRKLFGLDITWSIAQAGGMGIATIVIFKNLTILIAEVLSWFPG